MGFFKIKSLQKLRMGIGFCSKVQISWGEHFCELDGILPAPAFGFFKIQHIMIGTLFGKTENNKNRKKDSYHSRIPEEKKVENRNIKTCVVFLIAVSFIKKQIKLD